MHACREFYDGLNDFSSFTHTYTHTCDCTGTSTDFHPSGDEEVPPAGCSGCRFPRPLPHRPLVPIHRRPKERRKRDLILPRPLPTSKLIPAQPTVRADGVSVHVLCGCSLVHVCIHGVWGRTPWGRSTRQESSMGVVC